MTGRMPADLHFATAMRASSRGGSIMPTSPAKIRSCSLCFLECFIHFTPGQPKHAQCAVGHRATLLQEFLAPRRRERDDFVRPLLEGAALQQKFGRTFGVDRGFLPRARTTTDISLRCGVEGNFVDDRVIGIRAAGRPCAPPRRARLPSDRRRCASAHRFRQAAQAASCCTRARS